MSKNNDPKTVGHAIDGIEEFDNPLPRWWLLMFYASIVWAVVYQVLYPSWFGQGYLGWSQHTQYSDEIKEATVKYPVKVININDFISKPEQIEKGKQVFQQNCVSCHGPAAKGLIGPNLTDSTWIHGGKPEEIVNTITKGVAAKGMPTWGPVLGNEKVAQVASFVISLYDPNQKAPAAPVATSTKKIDLTSVIGNADHIGKGRELFKTNCVSCHGPEAKGLVGPNLTDATWIHGGKPEDIQKTITTGVAAKGMPTWGPILGDEKVADLTAFVYSLSHDKK